MGISGSIFTKYEGYKPIRVLDAVVNILKDIGYCCNEVEKICSQSGEYYFVGPTEYYSSEAFMILRINCTQESRSILPKDLPEGFIETIWIEDVRHTDMIVRMLYNYFNVFPNDLFDCDQKRLFGKTDIETIYNSFCWENIHWWFSERLKSTEISLTNKLKIEYNLKRNGKWQQVLCCTEKFEWLKMKKILIQYLEKNRYEYYIERYDSDRWADCFYTAIYASAGGEADMKFIIPEQVEDQMYGYFDFIKEGMCIAMKINYIPGTQKIIREIMNEYFKLHIDGYMYNTNEYDYSETGEHIYTKDTISTFGE